MKAARRTVRATHEHEFEAAPGLPEALPDGEQLLWQGKPAWRSLALHAFHVRALAVYFSALLAARLLFLFSEGAGAAEALRGALPLGLMFGFALGMLTLLAWLSARTTAYSLTNRRLVMRVGIVLTLTFNLPLKRLNGAGLALHGRAGTGDIPVQLAAPDKIAFFHLWPHARPWRLGRPEPMLRCIPDAARVAQALRTAWAQETLGLEHAAIAPLNLQPSPAAQAQPAEPNRGQALPA